MGFVGCTASARLGNRCGAIVSLNRRMTRPCQGSPFEHWCDPLTNPADLSHVVAPLFPALFSVTLYTHVTTQWCGAAVSSRLFACRVCVLACVPAEAHFQVREGSGHVCAHHRAARCRCRARHRSRPCRRRGNSGKWMRVVGRTATPTALTAAPVSTVCDGYLDSW